jgi:hypothetical protein
MIPIGYYKGKLEKNEVSVLKSEMNKRKFLYIFTPHNNLHPPYEGVTRHKLG